MKISPTKFKKEYLDRLAEIHWRHWAALGVASNVRPEENWAVDLEALIISTFVTAWQDKRLFYACLEWISKNAGWVNRSRLKKIAATATEANAASEKLFSLDVLKSADQTLRQFGVKLLDFKEARFHKVNTELINESQSSYETFQPRGVVTAPEIKKPALLQLKLRGILGRSARADVFLYLLYHDTGNSNSIAKELFYDQKNVYIILEKWVKTNLVTKIAGDRKGTYSLNNKKEWLKLIEVKKEPKYLNWVNTFLVLDKISKIISISHYARDEYLLSSFFRDILNEAKAVAKPLNIRFPEQGEYLGEEYFEPFAAAVLGLMGKLVGGR